jgi:hypothetical protein
VQYRVSSTLKRPLALAGIVALALTLFSGAAGAAPGDVLQSFTLDRSGTECAPPASSTSIGIVVVGKKLMVSCWDDHTISTFKTTTGARVGQPKVISGLQSLGALTYDSKTKKLYGCGDASSVGIVNAKAGTFTPAFSASCVDGLMWDPVGNTFWAGGDGAPTIEHYEFDGTLISSTDVTGILGGCGRTGIEAVNGQLMLATYDCGPIYASTRVLDSATVFVDDNGYTEDLACDNKTFKSLNKTAIWAVHAYDTEVVAYEAPASGSKRPACK